ncbi:MAG TPA: hypothetical protein VNC39_06330 [Acidocella sp.]|jgi:hypothetical protein|uniref:hypothetical protein n=1 Tax=Acidocella sp. TaxID=50710 RepID=UPI002C5446A6|nr:hypothetical protein [Acidocella sp.]HVE21576.1 hypothetical protein [Acidocella sp.]
MELSCIPQLKICENDREHRRRLSAAKPCSKPQLQRIAAGGLDLAYTDFDDEMSGINVAIVGLPVLRCSICGRDHLPDRSRGFIVYTHEQATKKGMSAISVTRRKLTEEYRFTNVSFIYDPDDYRYISGLEREFDVGFLTPVFFNRTVLLNRYHFLLPLYPCVPPQPIHIN